MRKAAILTIHADGSTELTQGLCLYSEALARFRELVSVQPLPHPEIMLVEKVKSAKNKAMPVMPPVRETTESTSVDSDQHPKTQKRKP
jgi:hypothetical protein